MGIRWQAAVAAATLLWMLPGCPARADEVVLLSTQMRPIEEAQKVRDTILKDFPGKVEYVTDFPPQLPVRLKAEQQAGSHTISLVGALHGERAVIAWTGLDHRSRSAWGENHPGTSGQPPSFNGRNASAPGVVLIYS